MSKRNRLVNDKLQIGNVIYFFLIHVYRENKYVITEKVFRIDVSADMYLERLTDHCFFSVACSCMIEETEQTFADTVEVRLRKPHLIIEVISPVLKFKS